MYCILNQSQYCVKTIEYVAIFILPKFDAHDKYKQKCHGSFQTNIFLCAGTINLPQQQRIIKQSTPGINCYACICGKAGLTYSYINNTFLTYRRNNFVIRLKRG